MGGIFGDVMILQAYKHSTEDTTPLRMNAKVAGLSKLFLRVRNAFRDRTTLSLLLFVIAIIHALDIWRPHVGGRHYRKFLAGSARYLLAGYDLMILQRLYSREEEPDFLTGLAFVGPQISRHHILGFLSAVSSITRRG